MSDIVWNPFWIARLSRLPTDDKCSYCGHRYGIHTLGGRCNGKDDLDGPCDCFMGGPPEE